MKSDSIVSRKRIMQSLHLDFAEQKLDQKKNKNSIKKNKKYLIFSHTNRFDSLTEFNQIKKTRFCILCIDASFAHSMHLFFLSISRSFSASRIASTYFMNFLQSNYIEIDSLMSQKYLRILKHNDVIKS